MITEKINAIDISEITETYAKLGINLTKENEMLIKMDVYACRELNTVNVEELRKMGIDLD